MLAFQIGDAAPVAKRTLGRTDFVVYAGASCDFNPMHTDEVAAQAAGQPSVFGHGMLSAGFLAGAVAGYVGVGRLTRYAVRFTKQVWPGDSVSTSVVVRSVRDGLVDLDCSLLNGAGDVLVQGSATARLDSGAPAAADDLAPAAGDPALAGPFASLVGARLPDHVLVVERGPVARFAAAVGDPSPVYVSADAAHASGLPGVPVPPTFPFVAQHFGALAELQPPADDRPDLAGVIPLVRRNNELVLHGEQEFRYGDPILVGDVLATSGVVESITVKPPKNGVTSTVLVLRLDYRRQSDSGQAGALLVSSRMTLLLRGRA